MWATFEQTVRKCPEAMAVLVGSESLSFTALRSLALEWADVLHATGVSPGERLVLPAKTDARWLALPLAAWRLGAVPVPVAAQDVADDRAKQVGGRVVQIDQTVEIGPSHMYDAEVPENLGSIVFTSGSSGIAKGVMQTQATLREASLGVAGVVGYGPGDRILCWVSPGHDYGWVQILATYVLGTTLVLPATQAPEAVREAMDDHRPTVLGGVPSVYAKWVQGLADLGCGDSVRIVMSTGAPMPRSVFDGLPQLFPGARRSLNYGLTETFRSASGTPECAEVAGRVVPGAKLWILNEDGAQCCPNEVGEIVHGGAGTFAGYWNDPERTARQLRAAPDGQGLAVWTGDFGRIDADGWLRVEDRRDRVIKSFGLKVSLSLVERTLAAVSGVSDVVAVPTPHPLAGQALCVFVEGMPGATLEARTLKQAARRLLPPESRPVALRILPKMPRLPSGKPDLTALVRSALDT